MKINQLDYYPRFVFNCDDEFGFATNDVEQLFHFSNELDTNPISKFKIGEEIKIKREDKPDPISYIVSNIEIRDIRYNTNEKLYGVYDDDRATFQNKDKFELMSIFISLELKK